MSERLQYVSPEYQARLDALAELLCTPERFGKVAVQDSVQLQLDIPDNIEVGEE